MNRKFDSLDEVESSLDKALTELKNEKEKVISLYLCANLIDCLDSGLVSIARPASCKLFPGLAGVIAPAPKFASSAVVLNARFIITVIPECVDLA